mmetsp:Transcript_70643/g.163308  ORF Transcript_70643/g.163308 Transcript_70643/m.163308 type:complete len:206 (+) Transcript_70643:370-987(+)
MSSPALGSSWGSRPAEPLGESLPLRQQWACGGENVPEGSQWGCLLSFSFNIKFSRKRASAFSQASSTTECNRSFSVRRLVIWSSFSSGPTEKLKQGSTVTSSSSCSSTRGSICWHEGTLHGLDSRPTVWPTRSSMKPSRLGLRNENSASIGQGEPLITPPGSRGVIEKCSRVRGEDNCRGARGCIPAAATSATKPSGNLHQSGSK